MSLYPTMEPAASEPGAGQVGDTLIANAGAPADGLTAAEQAANAEAAKLYTSMQPKEAPKVDVPANVQALREADSERKMFGAQSTLGDARIEDALMTVDGVDDTTKAAAAHEWREMAADVGASVAEVNTFIDLAQQTHREPPSADTVKAWQDQASRRLSEVYGSEAAHALTLARQLAMRDPRTAALLERNGLGNRPEVVMLFADLARREKVKGRL